MKLNYPLKFILRESFTSILFRAICNLNFWQETVLSKRISFQSVDMMNYYSPNSQLRGKNRSQCYLFKLQHPQKFWGIIAWSMFTIIINTLNIDLECWAGTQLMADKMQTDVLKKKEEKTGSRKSDGRQTEHLFGNDRQIWLKTGLSQLTATWELLLQSVCHLLCSVSANICSAECWISPLKRKYVKGERQHQSLLFIVLYCQKDSRSVCQPQHSKSWAKNCLHFSHSFSVLLYSTSSPLKKKKLFLFSAATLGRFQPSPPPSDAPDHQTNAHPRDS